MYVLSRNKTNNVSPVNPSLLYKNGVEGDQNYIDMFFVVVNTHVKHLNGVFMEK